MAEVTLPKRSPITIAILLVHLPVPNDTPALLPSEVGKSPLQRLACPLLVMLRLGLSLLQYFAPPHLVWKPTRQGVTIQVQ